MAQNGRANLQEFRDNVKAEIEQRIAEHRTAVAAAVAGVAAAPLNLLADGDSWFDYPLTDGNPFAPSDIVAQLPSLMARQTLILSLAHRGDATTQLMGVTKRDRLVEQLSTPANGRFDAILFSGGGNDLVGDQFRLWLQDADAAGGDPARALDQLALSDILGVVMTAYADLLAVRDGVDHNIPIFVHAYDFARPTGEGVCGYGPWLYPSLKSRGWMNGTGDVDAGAAIVRLILIEFEKQMRALAADPRNNVVYIQTQATLGQDDWANELHPTPDGFKRIAQKFATELTNRFPGVIS